MEHTRPLRKISIIVFQDDGWTCGQVLEFDIGAQARTLPTLYRRLHRAIVGHVAVRRAHGLEPFADLPPAPARYHEMFNASAIGLPSHLIQFPRPLRKIKIPAPEVRVAAAERPEIAVAAGQ